ncbi:MAG: hypothetical protein GWN01_16455, partial [Nitrosopumilaceae archaeon]|nr:hypothetical protein [Nitrosopumilaceae archaeon]NIU88890.1 hypothetical protein [Nitrosopumilaceae archaeon]NIV65973.1 hypothetical protein [Nitrosopumilaceae archaeon]NIX63028.1 hypothetical protein [Nitrosopumilaceae archaeon]
MKKEIEIPTKCPSCNFELETVNSQLFCRNDECPAQAFKKLEAFVKKMQIKGIGPAALKKLEFESYYDFYEFPIDYYQECLGEKIGTKVYKEVQKSKTVPFWRWLAALNIPLIGETAARKIADNGVNSVKDLMCATMIPLGP